MPKLFGLFALPPPDRMKKKPATRSLTAEPLVLSGEGSIGPPRRTLLAICLLSLEPAACFQRNILNNLVNH
jgi:hypothetical protein